MIRIVIIMVTMMMIMMNERNVTKSGHVLPVIIL